MHAMRVLSLVAVVMTAWSGLAGVAASAILWTHRYEGNVLPTVADPAWTSGGTFSSTPSTDGSILTLSNSAVANSGYYLVQPTGWDGRTSTGSTVEFRMSQVTGTSRFQIGAGDGQYYDLLLSTTRVSSPELPGDLNPVGGAGVDLNLTQPHTFRLVVSPPPTTGNRTVDVYINNRPTPAFSIVSASTNINRILFPDGATGALAGTVQYDFIRWTNAAALPPEASIFRDDFDTDTVGSDPAVQAEDVGLRWTIQETDGGTVGVVAEGYGNVLRLTRPSGNANAWAVPSAADAALTHDALVKVEFDLRVDSGGTAGSSFNLVAEDVAGSPFTAAMRSIDVRFRSDGAVTTAAGGGLTLSGLSHELGEWNHVVALIDFRAGMSTITVNDKTFFGVPFYGTNVHQLRSIAFSFAGTGISGSVDNVLMSIIVPEPAGLALAVLGALGLSIGTPRLRAVRGKVHAGLNTMV